VEAANAPKPEPEAPKVRFEVRAGLNGTNRDDWSSVAEFDNGRDAAAWQREHGQPYRDAGKSLAIVRVELTAPTIDWRAREQGRLDDGTYFPLPGEWGRLVARYLPDHFAHVSSSDKRKVAFTETPSAGERDRQKVLSAVEYFNRHLSDHFGSYNRDGFVSDMLGSSVSVLFSPLGNASALSDIYMECDDNGYDVSSCMSHVLGDYSSEIHPVEVYAMGGDLTLAFLRGHDDCGEDDEGNEWRQYDYDPDADWNGCGPIIARCLVWPERKEFGRVYGTSDNQRLLRTALQAQGYTSSDLSGARIAKVESEGGSSSCDCDECDPEGSVAFVMPYLDIGDGYFSDCGDHWRAGRGHGTQNRAGTSTSGLINVPVPIACDHCGDEVPGDTLARVYVDEYDHERWCPSCRSSETTYCSVTDIHVPNDQVTRVLISSRYRDRDYTVAAWALDEFIEDCDSDTRPVLCNDGVYRSRAFQCRDCGETFATEERQVMGRDHLCGSCADERRASPELPLTIAA
jgi:hypothetical protein